MAALGSGSDLFFDLFLLFRIHALEFGLGAQLGELTIFTGVLSARSAIHEVYF